MDTPYTVSAADPVASAIRVMQDNDVWHLAMLDDQNQACGMVSLSDILVALQPPSRPQTMDHTQPLPPLVDLLADGHDPALPEPVSSVSRSRLISVSPTTRLTETLARLLETGRDAVLVQDNQQLLGIVLPDFDCKLASGVSARVTTQSVIKPAALRDPAHRAGKQCDRVDRPA